MPATHHDYSRIFRDFAKRSLGLISPRLLLKVRALRSRKIGDKEELNFVSNFPYGLLPNGYGTLPHLPNGEPTSVAIDVGANIGVYSIFLSSQFDRVLSVEPVPMNVTLLRNSLPDNCTVYETALGRSENTVDLRIPLAGLNPNTALASVSVDHDFPQSESDSIQTLSVPQTTGDQLVAEFEQKTDDGFRIAFVKIDVEGYEFEVLEGLGDVIKSHRPIFLIEIEKRHNPAFKGIFSFMHQEGYEVFVLRDGNLQPSSSAAVDDAYEMLKGGDQDELANPSNLKREGQLYTNNFVFVPTKGR